MYNPCLCESSDTHSFHMTNIGDAYHLEVGIQSQWTEKVPMTWWE